MFTVYVLYSPPFQKIYIGFTTDLIKRFHSHNRFAKTGYTKRYRPWIVVYTEIFESKSMAMEREKNLKSGAGRAWIKKELLKSVEFISA